MSRCQQARRTPHAVARRLALWLLAWFALSLGAAVASPVVQPRSVQLVCTSGAMQLVLAGDDGVAHAAWDHGMGCALCLTGGAPPPSPAARVQSPVQAAVLALQPAVAAPVAVVMAAPLPARGPPAAG